MLQGETPHKELQIRTEDEKQEYCQSQRQWT